MSRRKNKFLEFFNLDDNPSLLTFYTGYKWPKIISGFPPFLFFFDVILFPTVFIALALLTPCLFPFYLVIWFLFRGER